jgi:hypothetical protein
VSQNWHTNYLLPYRGCLNVHEKNMENMFPTKKLIIFIIIVNDNTMYTKIYSYIITLQCYRRGFKIIFSISKASKFSIMQD